MAAGLIPFSEISGFLDNEQIWGLEERAEYTRWIQFIDGVMLDLVNKDGSNS